MGLQGKFLLVLKKRCSGRNSHILSASHASHHDSQPAVKISFAPREGIFMEEPEHNVEYFLV